MHGGNINFLLSMKGQHREHFTGARVLELGSLNVNGSAREFFENCEYVGIDIVPGKDVDQVVAAKNTEFTPGYFDTIVCLSMFEHDPDWRESLAHNLQWLRPGGLLVCSWGAEGNRRHPPEPWAPVPLAQMRELVQILPLRDVFMAFENADCDGAADMVAIKAPLAAPKIAICSVVWNKLQMTRDWVVSVRHNSGHTVKIYLADNGSTEPAARQLLQQLADVHVLYEDNATVYRGANQLMRLAYDDGADIICLSNNDMLVGPGWLEPIVREHQKGGKKFWLPHDALKNPHAIVEDTRRLQTEWATRDAKTQPGNAGWCMIFPRECLPLFMPIPEELRIWYGDAWINRKLNQAGWSCDTVLDSFVLHYGSISFYARPDYVADCAADKAVWERLTGVSG